MSLPRRARDAIAAAAGVAVVVSGWLLVVPWDWSTRRDGRPLVDPPGDGQTLGRAFAVLAVVLVVASIVAVWRLRAGIALWVAGALTWLVMVQWRAWSAEVSGANMAMLWVPVSVFLAALGACIVAVTGSIARSVRLVRDRP